MATAAQTAANRANAQHSTGPRTEEGKAHSSQNNFHHGFRSQSVLIPGDNPAEYDTLLAELTEHFDPKDLTQQRYVREMADAEWRLRRVRAHQEFIFTRKIQELAKSRPEAEPLGLQTQAFALLHRDTHFILFLRYESKYERQYDRAYHGWVAIQEKLNRRDLRRIDAQLKAVGTIPVSPNTPKPSPSPVPKQTPALPDEPNSSPTPSAVRTPALPDEPNFIARNALCPCGSGQKYKRCCGRSAPATAA